MWEEAEDQYNSINENHISKDRKSLLDKLFILSLILHIYLKGTLLC